MKWYDRAHSSRAYRYVWWLWFSAWNQQPLHHRVFPYARITRKLGWSNRGEMNYVVLFFLFGIPLIALAIAYIVHFVERIIGG